MTRVNAALDTLKEWKNRIPGAFTHHLWAATVLASIVELLKFYSFPVDIPFTAVMASSAYSFAEPEAKDERQALALVLIDQGRFNDKYRATSPLDRCQLHADIRQILAVPGLRTLAIDFDLSPTLRGKSGQNSTEQACETALNELLTCPSADKSCKGPKIIVALPPSGGDAVPWTRADAFLSSSFGVVSTHTIDDRPRFGAELARSLCNHAVSGKPPACTTTVPTGPHPTDVNISFDSLKYLFKGGEPLQMSDPCLLGKDCGIRHVLLGGDYRLIAGDNSSREDQHLTPIGPLPGAHIHAAIAADPYRIHSHWPAYLIDIFIGSVVFGPLVDWLWGRYFRQRTMQPPGSGLRDPGLAYLWLLAIFLSLVSIVLLALFIATAAYAACGIWIAPATMAVGMAIEAFVTGSVNGAKGLLSPHGHGKDNQPFLPQARKARTRGETVTDVAVAVLASTPTALGALIVAYAIVKLSH